MYLILTPCVIKQVEAYVERVTLEIYWLVDL